ncbi:MAG: MBL fold metallo-hydrolase [Dysgonamonadaceae bacterium]|jgi:glyoxylase-like metal-dependent hydrolase (beta-lactamase superfamily II)|nr:MBL fold metallo-hydrolase [Dysgonamonadaceae bacterium]
MLRIKVFVFNPVRENTYLLYDRTKEAVIIDCGACIGNEKKQLSDFIHEQGLTLKHVLNTHLHFDHVLGNKFLYETYGLKPEYHLADEAMPGLKDGIVDFESFTCKYDAVFAEQYIEDKGLISFGDSCLEALSTPGHSPGSLSFYSEKDACVFTGDALFRFGIGRTDLWGGNYEELIQSIKNKLFALPGNTVVYPGHAEASTIGEEKTHNPYLKRI